MEDPTQRIRNRCYAQGAERAVADDRFDVDRLAGTIDAAFGEYGGGDGKPVGAPRRSDVETPGREVTGPGIDGDDGPIERQSGGDVARESALDVIAVFAGVAQAGEPDETLGVCRAAGPDTAKGIVQLDLDARFWNAVLDTGDPDDGFFLPNARGDAEIGRLEQDNGRRPRARFHIAVRRIRDANGAQRGCAGAGGVDRGAYHTHEGHVAPRFDGERTLCCARGQPRPHISQVPWRSPQDQRLETVGDGCGGDEHRVDVDVPDWEGAVSVPLDQHHAVVVRHCRVVAGRPKGLHWIADQPLTEDIVQD